MGVKPRDPVSRAVWDLPSELLGVRRGIDVRNTSQNHREIDADSFANIHFPRIMHLKQNTHNGYNNARLHYYDMRCFAHFDVSIIVTMFQIGMEPEARDLYHFTKLNRLKNYSVSNVAWLYQTGMRAEACDLHMLSVTSYASSWATDPLFPRWFPTYSAPYVIKLFEIGMEYQALDLHKRSVEFADEYSTVDIISLAEAGMKDQAMTLHIQTMDDIMGMSNGVIVDAIVALTSSTARLKPLAEELLMRG